MTVVGLSTAVTTLITLVLDIYHADTNGCLEVPVTGEDPLVAAGDAATDEPSLMTVVLQFVPPAEGRLDAIGVKLSAEGMGTDEPTVEAVAEPVTVLGVDDPVLDELLVISMSELPGVQAVEYLERVFLTCSDFHSDIRRRGSIIQEIGLQGHLLCSGVLDASG